MLVQSATPQSVSGALASMVRSVPDKEDTAGVQATADGAASGTSRYDFSHMTPAQMRDAVNRLIRGGELSLDDTSSLLSIMAPPSGRLRADGTTVSAAEGERIDNTPVDAFAKLRDGLAGARWRNDSMAEAALSRTLAALQRVQGTVSSVDILA